MNDVIRDTVASHNKQAAKLEWRVLVVDKVTMKMVSACTKMHELSVEGITSKRLFLSCILINVFLVPSCGDDREEEEPHALYGGNLLDTAITDLCEAAPARFHQPEQQQLQSSSRVLY